MSFMEKNIVVKDEKGDDLSLKLKAVKRIEMRQLNALIAPVQFKRSEAEDLPINMAKFEDYKEQMILFTVKEPKLTLERLGEFEPKEFDKLFAVCQEVNGLKEGQSEADEKK